MNQGAAVPPVAPAAAAAAAAAAPDAAQDKDAAAAHAADWSDSADNSNSQDDEFLPQAQGPSLSYERKIRLHKYAENRARSCLGLLADSSNALWKVHDCKNDIGVYKPSSDWSESVSAKAVVFANAAFPNVLKTIYDLKTSDKFKLFMRKILGDMFLDAEVLEDLNGTGVYPSANPPRDAREMYKQAAIKWWAIKSGTLASKSSDFYVLEYIGIETSGGDIVACYLFQESLAEVGGMPHIQGNNLERSQFDALICKFERTSSPDYKDDFVTISIAFQRPPPMVSLFRSNPAVEMVTQLARGLRDLLEDPPELQEISVVKTSAWVKDNPSHSQDLSGALETPHDEKEQVPSSKEERMPHKSQTELSSIGFPRLGSLHPLGTTIDFVSNQMEIDRSIDVNSSSSLCSMQSSDWSKLINMTAVITGINEDGSLSTTSSVASGTNVVLMETSAQSLKTAINKMGAQAVESNKFYIHETIGCLMFLSAGVGAYKDWSGGASLMGMTTFGEIGHLPNSNDFPHYDSLMFGAIIFSKRKRKEYLYF
ncbi:putative DEAD/DEAH box RNA helicase [Phytophthora cinnamomi]|uniref:putative DEAD/DEAH box RNA helicase n=1 Tax=Phytophthora cinnamomi TaxID=4785 RepID=UPI0035599525|nr:putative DEAD/DEAH box RNA helicase [Phytophthora cinnamomi]